MDAAAGPASRTRVHGSIGAEEETVGTFSGPLHAIRDLRHYLGDDFICYQTISFPDWRQQLVSPR